MSIDPDMSRLSQLFGHAISLGWKPNPRKSIRHLRDDASIARIPAELIDGVWYYRNRNVHLVAAASGMTRESTTAKQDA